jgi:hypothetical protein
MAEERKYRFNDEEINAPVDTRPEDVRAAWAEVHPALENADILTAEDGSIEFRTRAGTKGN